MSVIKTLNLEFHFLPNSSKKNLMWVSKHFKSCMTVFVKTFFFAFRSTLNYWACVRRKKSYKNRRRGTFYLHERFATWKSPFDFFFAFSSLYCEEKKFLLSRFPSLHEGLFLELDSQKMMLTILKLDSRSFFCVIIFSLLWNFEDLWKIFCTKKFS